MAALGRKGCVEDAPKKGGREGVKEEHEGGREGGRDGGMLWW